MHETVGETFEETARLLLTYELETVRRKLIEYLKYLVLSGWGTCVADNFACFA